MKKTRAILLVKVHGHAGRLNVIVAAGFYLPHIVKVKACWHLKPGELLFIKTDSLSKWPVVKERFRQGNFAPVIYQANPGAENIVEHLTHKYR